MNHFLRLALASTVFCTSSTAFGQDQETATGNSILCNSVTSVLVYVAAAAFVCWLYTIAVKKTLKRTADYMVIQEKHHQEVVQLLERIARAVEKKDAP